MTKTLAFVMYFFPIFLTLPIWVDMFFLTEMNENPYFSRLLIYIWAMCFPISVITTVICFFRRESYRLIVGLLFGMIFIPNLWLSAYAIGF